MGSTVKKLSLFAITWPIFIELFLHVLTGSVDTMMLSFVSDGAVAAVGVANQIVFFAILLFGFISTGTSVVISQYLGAKLYKEASKISALAITLNLLFGILVSSLIYIFSHEFLVLLQLPSQLFDYADLYMKIVGGTLFIEALILTASAVMKSYGFTKDTMYIALGINLLNAIGNYLFIFGAFGFPQLGVAGVSLSTAVSRLIGCIVLFVLLYRRLPEKIKIKDYVAVNIEYVKQILKIGLPAAGENLSYHTSQMVITTFISALGTAALATKVYTSNIMYFVMLFGFALGQGTSILIGHLVGAGQKDRAYRQLLTSLKWSLLVTLGVALLSSAFREKLIGIFSNDPSIIATGSTLLLLCIILEPGRTFNLVVISSLRATGDAQFPVWMGIVSMWGISVTLAYFLGITMQLGLVGMWIAFATDEWIRGILMYLRWKSKAWEKKILISSPQEKGEDVS